MFESIESTKKISLYFDKVKNIYQNVIPVVVQDHKTKEVLTVAYINKEAFKTSLLTKKVVFFSTSRNKIWFKGATSDNEFQLIEARVNCEQNSLLFLARPIRNGICHTKNSQNQYRMTCFYRKVLDQNNMIFSPEE